MAVRASGVVHAARGREGGTKPPVIARRQARRAHATGVAERGGCSHVVQGMVIWRVRDQFFMFRHTICVFD